jgi:hypothetical protein
MKSAELLEVLANVLPDPQDVDVWPWFNWDIISHLAKSCLYQVKNVIGFLLKLNEQGYDSKEKQFLAFQGEMILKHITLISDFYNYARMTPAINLYLRDSKAQSLPAYTVLRVLWPIIYPQFLDRALSLSAFEIQSWPMVLYHPYHTLELFYSIVINLDQSNRDLLVTLYKTASSFKICVTHPRLRMTPTLWNNFLAEISPNNNELEYFRELGGNIEPLTWDEGQGQGVIVRLPWVKEN